MKRAVVWISVFIIAAVAACSVRYVIFGRLSSKTASTDVRVVTKPWFGIFCEGAVFHTWGPFQVTSLPAFPDVLSHMRHKFVNVVPQHVPDNGYRCWHFYLVEGSSVRIKSWGQGNSCSWQVLKGKKNLRNRIKQNHHAEGQENNCKNFSFPMQPIDQSDVYFFCYSTGISHSVDAQFELNLTTYDIGKNEGHISCAKGELCNVMTVALNPWRALVYSAKFNQNELYRSWFTLEVDFIPRFSMYFVFFGLVPLLVGIIISTMITKPTEKVSKLKSFRDLPPKYRELVNEAPPQAYPHRVNHI